MQENHTTNDEGRELKETKTQLTKLQKRGRRRRRVWRTVLIVVGIIVCIRIALPYVILHFLNKKLANMPEYVGHIDDLDMFLIGGRVTVKEIDLKKKNGEIPVPFFWTNRVKVGIEWKSLFKGHVVATIDVDSFMVNMVQGPTKAKSQTTIDKSWIELADELMPISINTIEIHSGEVHFRNYYSSPKIDVFLNRIYVFGENLSNVNEEKKVLPSTVTVSANGYGGLLKVLLKVDPLNKVPTFDVSAELVNLNIPSINDLIKAYANFDVARGKFSIYSEIAAKDYNITGYAKPIIKDLEIYDERVEQKDPLPERVIESLIDFGADLIENEKKEQIATRIEINGKLTDPNLSVWQIVGDALANAFIQALIPSLDGTININSQVKGQKKGFLEELIEPDVPKAERKRIKEQKRREREREKNK